MRIKPYKLILYSLILFLLKNQTVYSQDITSIKIDGFCCCNLHTVLSKIEGKHSLDFQYDSVAFKKIDFFTHPINKPLEKFLEQVCKQHKLSYYIMKNNVILIIDRYDDPEQVILKSKSSYSGPSTRTNFTLSGKVRDHTHESLPFVSIYVKNTQNGTTSNVDGYFTFFNVPTDTSSIVVSYVGYVTKTIKLFPELVKKDLIIELEPSVVNLDEVVITGEREDLVQVSKDISIVSITPKKINTLPSIGEKDIFRSFQLLPGISGSNESSSGLYVRGGTPDQNLILYDGFTVYHVDHLYGMFSAFNSDAIKEVKLSKGGFDSKFGGRLSSVMEITGKDGNEKNFNMGGGVSFLTFNGFTEIPLGGKGSIIFTGRKSFNSFLYSNIFDNFNSDDNSEDPQPQSGPGGSTAQEEEIKSYFYDLNAKATYKFKKDILSLSFFNGQDDLDNSISVPQMPSSDISISGGSNDITKWGNWGSSLKWSRKWNNSLYSNALISYSNYYSQRDRSLEINVVKDDEETNIKRGAVEDNNLQDFTFKLDNEYKTGQNNQINFGIQTSYYLIDYDFIREDTISILSRHDKGYVSSLYLNDKWEPAKKLRISPGIRLSYYSVTNKPYIEPRASVNYKITDKFSIKGAWGKYYQFANRIVREDIESGSRDFWILSDNEAIPVSSATHYIAGLSYETKNFLFDIEGYYKNLTGLSEYSLRYTTSFSDVNFDESFYEGTGTAKGIEFLLQKKHGKYTGWLAYSLGEVLYEFPFYGEEPFYANQDVTNEFKIVNSFKYKKWTFSGTWIYGTGKPYTAPTGAYELEMADGTTNTFLSLGSKNCYRLPDYHRLDLSATLEFRIGETGIGNLGFSLFNVYNRKNTWYKEFQLVEDELIETDVTFLGIVPNISLSIKLR